MPQWHTLGAANKTFLAQGFWGCVSCTIVFTFVGKSSCMFLGHLSTTSRVMCRAEAINRWHTYPSAGLPRMILSTPEILQVAPRFRNSRKLEKLCFVQIRPCTFCTTLWWFQDGLKHLLLHNNYKPTIDTNTFMSPIHNHLSKSAKTLPL